MDYIKISTINLKYDSSQQAIKYLENYVMNNRIDVACMQETGKKMNRIQLNDYTLINNSSSTGRGTAILFHKRLKAIQIEMHPNNRIIKIKFENISIINTYGYPKSEAHEPPKRRSLFSKELIKYISNREPTILLGDFNAVEGKNEGGVYMKELTILKKTFNLTDLAVHSQKIEPFFFNSAGKSRIDRIYFNPQVQIIPETYQNLNYLMSDHSALMVEVKGNAMRGKAKIKSANWKLNSSILIEEDYKNYIESLIKRLENAKHLYESIIDWWEEVKRRVKSLSIIYCKERRSNERSKTAFLEMLLNEAKENNRNLFLEIKKQLSIVEKKKFEGNIIRGKGKYPVEKEKFNITHVIDEKNGSNRITILKNGEGKLTVDQKGIEKIVTDYYENLYKLKPNENTL